MIFLHSIVLPSIGFLIFNTFELNVMSKILLLESDLILQKKLFEMLSGTRTEVLCATNAREARELFIRYHPYAIVADISGEMEEEVMELVTTIRKKHPTPVLFICKESCPNKFRAAKKFRHTDIVGRDAPPYELLMRLESLIEHNESPVLHDVMQQLGIYTFNSALQELQQGDKIIHLNRLQSMLLYVLVGEIGRFITRSMLVSRIWGTMDYKSKEDSLNTLLCELRKLLQDDTTVVIESRTNSGVRIYLR